MIFTFVLGSPVSNFDKWMMDLGIVDEQDRCILATWLVKSGYTEPCQLYDLETIPFCGIHPSSSGSIVHISELSRHILTDAIKTMQISFLIGRRGGENLAS